MKKKGYKIIVALFFSGILLAGVFIVTTKKQEESQKPSENVIVKSQNATTSPQTAIDTDKDGLLDWEEALWNTDANNEDTDGDGTEDGAEVKSGRNPTIKGPKDVLNATTGTLKTAQEDTLLTPTEKLGREMFAEYLALKQSGVMFDEQTTSSFANELIQKTATDITYRVYSEKDLLLAPQDNSETIKAYGNALSATISQNSSNNENELLIFSRFVDSGNKKDLLPLMPIISSYRGMLNGVLSLSIPKSAVEVNLEFANALSFTLKSLENMSNSEPDPFLSIITLQRHLNAAQQLQDSLDKLQKYFIVQNIDFTQ